jgi:hypothetical protein
MWVENAMPRNPHAFMATSIYPPAMTSAKVRKNENVCLGLTKS